MDAIKGFFQKYGATRVDGRRHGWDQLATPDLERWLADYQRMIDTKQKPSGEAMSESDLVAIRQMIEKMRNILDSRTHF